MAISFINSATGTATTSNPTVTVNVPTGTANNDAMLMFANVGSGGYPTVPTVTTPAGWNLIENTSGHTVTSGSIEAQYVFYRIASSEPASYNVVFGTGGGSVPGSAVTIATYRSTTTPDPRDTTATQGNGTTSATAAAQTTDATHCWAISGGGSIGTPLIPSGYTTDQAAFGANKANIVVSHKDITSIGTTGSAIVTGTTVTISQLVTLKPATLTSLPPGLGPMVGMEQMTQDHGALLCW